MIRPSRLGLARVSIVRGEGPQEGIAFIDEYILTTEPVVDYLTEFSGVKGNSFSLILKRINGSTAGDLDKTHSLFPLVSLKVLFIYYLALVNSFSLRTRNYAISLIWAVCLSGTA